MKLWQRLTPRIGFASVACALVGAMCAGVAASDATADILTERLQPLLRRLLQAEVRTRCQANPRAWAMHLSGGLHVYAYNATTMQSVHPGAPAIDPALARELLESGAHVHFLNDRAVTIRVDMKQPGPCGAVVLVWGRDFKKRGWALGYVLLVISAPLMLATLAAFVLVVRPLIRRIQRLGEGATRVGSEAFEALAVRPPDEVGELAVALNRAHKRITDETEALGQHLANVAHDLRTPIAALQLALEEVAKDDSAHDTSRSVTHALQETVYLGGLVDDLWVACQLRDGLAFESSDAKADLTSIVEQVELRFGWLARRRGISLDLARSDHPLWVACRGILVQQAFSSLVHNAVSYVEPGGHVAIILEPQGSDGFSFAVLDDGPGVPPAELPRIGERTFRSDHARHRRSDGGGLGLAITHEVCEALGWTITFSKNEPRGLRVEIRGALGAPQPAP